MSLFVCFKNLEMGFFYKNICTVLSVFFFIYFDSQTKIRFEQIKINLIFCEKNQDSYIQDWVFDLMNKFGIKFLDL